MLRCSCISFQYEQFKSILHIFFNVVLIIFFYHLLQWNAATNTVWWQDFPRRRALDYLSLFVQTPVEEINQDSRSDFAAQLASFMASLVIDVPSQAHWIVELTKYDFASAAGHLVASVPGIHSYRNPNLSESTYSKPVSFCLYYLCANVLDIMKVNCLTFYIDNL